MKTGRKRPQFRSRLHLQHYRTAVAIGLAPIVDYSRAALAAIRQIKLNDQLGCCVVAAGDNVMGVATGNAGACRTVTDAEVIADYEAIGGYDPSDPNSDQGCDPSVAVSYWTTHGMADGVKILGSVGVNPADATELMTAITLFEHVFFGGELPDQWISPFPSSDGFIWDTDPPDPQNGHQMMLCGYDNSGPELRLRVVTWGLMGWITLTGFARFCAAANSGDCSVLLTPDLINKATGKSPAGIDWSGLVADFDAMGGNVPVPAPAPPTPAPVKLIARAIPVGAKGADTTATMTAARLADLVLHGCEYVGRYLPQMTVAEATLITSTTLPTGAKMGLVLFNFSRPNGWAPTAALGNSDAARDVAQMRALGLPAGACIVFDLEGCHGPANSTKAHLEAWAAGITAAGFLPALYVGAAPGGLDADGLYALKGIRSYVSSMSKIPTVTTRGFCAKQAYPGNVALPTVTVDWSQAGHDFLGGACVALYAV